MYLAVGAHPPDQASPPRNMYNPMPSLPSEFLMHLLNTYDTKDDADDAAAALKGLLRIASERDDTTTVYNLFGEATWANLYSLKMYNLVCCLKNKISVKSSMLAR
ncbi:hypothetical protein ALQ65_01619 [Pseudomonas syringae pv. coriandricola]|uniref:Uncharacterized protein n=1 Tax=Pseudomonas syringae pv. coriandricola TaxID=264453 RepID=A0A3M3JMI8_9PSED|nr:hypothetical protein ALQ65_01619 [Pseudomonas syringae pv. coriandricola]